MVAVFFFFKDPEQPYATVLHYINPPKLAVGLRLPSIWEETASSYCAPGAIETAVSWVMSTFCCGLTLVAKCGQGVKPQVLWWMARWWQQLGVGCGNERQGGTKSNAALY